METALVLASAVEIGDTEAGSNMVVTVEHMQKISDQQVTALSLSMAREWKSVLTPACFEIREEVKRASSEEMYWTPESARKVRRIVSEPMSPDHAKKSDE